MDYFFCKHFRSKVFDRTGYRGCLMVATRCRSPSLGNTMGQCWLEASEDNVYLGSNFLDNEWEKIILHNAWMFVGTITCSPTCNTLSAWTYFEIFFPALRSLRFLWFSRQKKSSEVRVTSIFIGVTFLISNYCQSTLPPGNSKQTPMAEEQDGWCSCWKVSNIRIENHFFVWRTWT